MTGMRLAGILIWLFVPALYALAITLPYMRLDASSARRITRTIVALVLISGLIIIGRAVFLVTLQFRPGAQSWAGALFFSILGIYSTILGVLGLKRLSDSVVRQAIGLTFFWILLFTRPIINAIAAIPEVGIQNANILQGLDLILIIWLSPRTWRILITKIQDDQIAASTA